MNPDIVLRSYQLRDAEAVAAVTLLAFSQYSELYEQWNLLSRRISAMSTSVENAEIVVAESATGVCGAVGYLSPGSVKANFIPHEWAYIRLLVVDPEYSGKGIGHALAKECVKRAQRDLAQDIGLHSSPIMDRALAMYSRMGFKEERKVPDILGVPYSIYRLSLT